MAEQLVEFTRRCRPLDDQALYNLYRYHRTRARICEAAIDGWQEALDQAERSPGYVVPGQLARWRDEVLRWQDALEERYQDELSELQDYQDEIVEAGNPVLTEQVTTLPRLTREPPGPENRHHPDYGTDRALPAPLGPPPARPPAPVIDTLREAARDFTA